MEPKVVESQAEEFSDTRQPQKAQSILALLPEEIHYAIIEFLSLKELHAVRRVCLQYHAIVQKLIEHITERFVILGKYLIDIGSGSVIPIKNVDIKSNMTFFSGGLSNPCGVVVNDRENLFIPIGDPEKKKLQFLNYPSSFLSSFPFILKFFFFFFFSIFRLGFFFLLDQRDGNIHLLPLFEVLFARKLSREKLFGSSKMYFHKLARSRSRDY